MKERFLRLSINSDLIFGRMAVDKMLEFIRSNYCFIDDNDIGDLKLILSELVYNAVIHGNKMDAEKVINIEIRLDGYGLITSSIKDEGGGYDYNNILTEISNMDSSGAYSVSESGRGVLLASALSDSLSFNKMGNEIVFSKKVALNNVQHNNS